MIEQTPRAVYLFREGVFKTTLHRFHLAVQAFSTVRNFRYEKTETVSDRIRKLRGDTSTYIFARQCAMAQGTYESIENGQKEPTLKQIRKIASACSVGERYLLTGDERAKEWPINDRVLSFLETHPELREKIYAEFNLDEGELGKRLRDKRAELNLSQMKAAGMLGISRSTLVEVENGANKNYSVLEKVRVFLDGKPRENG